MLKLAELLNAINNIVKGDPVKKGIRLEKAELRLEKKKLKFAKQMYRQIKREFKKDGFSPEELEILNELKKALNQRRIDLIKM